MTTPAAPTRRRPGGLLAAVSLVLCGVALLVAAAAVALGLAAALAVAGVFAVAAGLLAVNVS